MNNLTLFLDRDGVINRRIPGAYVKLISEFHFLDGVLKSIPKLNKYFSQIVIVTNQQGVGKGLMSRKDIERVHQHMLTEINQQGGQIDGVYYSPFLSRDTPFGRKPNPGMAFEAKADHPAINFSKSIMVGDSPSDILFGKQLGMQTVYLNHEQREDSDWQNVTPDFTFKTLEEFTNQLVDNTIQPI